VRFATQLEFVIEDKTRESIIKNAHLLQNISWERIRDEFLKILSSDHPADGVLFLKQTGLLHFILPEIEECFAIEQKSPERHHIYDVGTHLIETLRHCFSADPITRLAALLHDVGKKDTQQIDPESGIITFYNHEIVGANIANTVAERLRLSKKERFKLVKLVRYHMFSVSELQTDKAVRRFIRKIGLENLDDILLLRTADRVGSGAQETSWRTELFKKRLIEVQQQPFEIKDLKITGHDVMQVLGIKPGPHIGDILEEIFEEVEDKKIENEREVLLERLKSMRT
jgi:putative nucleotidyltransferase with HDIG domain